jgi:methylglutaconyl-CoA hydratase
MPDELVHYGTDRTAAMITLDSPHNRNALSGQLRDQLRDQLARAIADDAARTIVISHTGPVFCAGMDMTEIPDVNASTKAVTELAGILTQLMTSPKPVIARIGGPARAGGIGLLAACDIAIAVEQANFAFSEVRVGVVPAVISVTTIPKMSTAAVYELFLTGEIFSATRARAIGLINAVVPAEQLDSQVADYLSMIALGAPGALAATKRLIRQPTELDQLFSQMIRMSAEHFSAPEGQEGMAAFREKRRPLWAEPT